MITKLLQNTGGEGAGVGGDGGGDVKEIQGLKDLGKIWLFDIWRANK